VGAKVDLSVLYHVMCEDIEMCMCVAPRTKADQEGGVLVGFKDRPMLIESVQVPKQHTEDFRKKFTHFNTNNLWVSLRAIQRMMLAGGFNDNVVVQERVVDGIRVLQLETLAGGAIQNFDKYAQHVQSIIFVTHNCLLCAMYMDVFA
jgi:UTP--glucose-1-phosphate uridylyltransferase